MRSLYVIGPTQVGKSKATRRLVDDLPDVALVDLDDELDPLMDQTGRTRIDLAQDWSVIEPILDRCEAPDGTRRVVVIGAGTRDMQRAGRPEFEQWLTPRRDRVVLVTADPVEVFKRYQGPREFADFRWFEFESRRGLYALAATTVDVSHLSEETATRHVVRAIRVRLERVWSGHTP